ncbi:MAG: hypothetical protein GY799_28855 [Desulfobulbaceae bacterium]|nr:hypothetical protein [Desulfobulbaceae bacterium]
MLPISCLQDKRLPAYDPREVAGYGTPANSMRKGLAMESDYSLQKQKERPDPFHDPASLSSLSIDQTQAIRRILKGTSG